MLISYTYAVTDDDGKIRWFGPLQTDDEDFRNFFAHRPPTMFDCRVTLMDEVPPDRSFAVLPVHYLWTAQKGWRDFLTKK